MLYDCNHKHFKNNGLIVKVELKYRMIGKSRGFLNIHSFMILIRCRDDLYHFLNIEKSPFRWELNSGSYFREIDK